MSREAVYLAITVAMLRLLRDELQTIGGNLSALEA